jgi:hypothetical protein
MNVYIDIIFDGPPGADGGGRFVEVEDSLGHSFKLGDWVQRRDGNWALRIHRDDLDHAFRRLRLVPHEGEAPDDSSDE